MNISHDKKNWLIEPDAITDFEGADYGFLSNFHEASFELDGKVWSTVEHAFQAAKCEDAQEAENIRHASTPGKAKKMGRAAKMREDWDEIKDNAMYEAVYAKFSQNPDLAEALDATGNRILVEGTRWHDNIWGQCWCGCKDNTGQNRLGQILMIVRDELRNNSV